MRGAARVERVMLQLGTQTLSIGAEMATSKSDGGPIRKFVDVQKALRGASYPADKDSLLETAKNNGADDEVMEALNALPDQEYGSPAEVSKGIGQEE